MDWRREGVITNGIAPRKLAGFLVGLGEHAFLVITSVVLMVLGLVLIVTMIMPPAGVAIGLLGFVMFVVGMTVRMDYL